MIDKYFNHPCGIHADDENYCHFLSYDKFGEPYCLVDSFFGSDGTPFIFRTDELEEVEIMESYPDKDEYEKEIIVSKKHKCHLYITTDELIDAIQLYRKNQNIYFIKCSNCGNNIPIIKENKHTYGKCNKCGDDYVVDFNNDRDSYDNKTLY